MKTQTQTQTHTVSDELSQMIDGVSVTVNLAENTVICDGAYGRKVYPQTEPLRGMSDVDIAQHQAAQAYLDENNADFWTNHPATLFKNGPTWCWEDLKARVIHSEFPTRRAAILDAKSKGFNF